MKYALIGCGMISPNHIRAALDNNLDIVAICDIVEENRKKVIELIPEGQRTNVHEYVDYKDMLSIEKPELVALALGSGLKRRISIDCMRSGANVIVEKPIALSLDDADEMIKVAKENNVLLCVNHQLRFGKTIRTLKREAEMGYFGKIFHGTVQVLRNRNQAYFDAAKWRGTWANDGGTLMNQCIHYTDLLQWVVGSDVEEVFAYTDRLAHPYIEAEDLGLALVKFKNGAYGVIEGTVNTYPKNLNDSLSLFGEKGSVVLSDKDLETVDTWNFSDGPQNRDDASSEFNIENLGSGHTPLYANVIDAIERGTELLCPPEDGRRALELILAIYKSRKTGLPVKLPMVSFSTIDMTGEFE